MNDAKTSFLNLKLFLTSIIVLSFAYFILVFNSSISSTLEKALFSTSSSNQFVNSNSKEATVKEQMAEGGVDWKNAQSIYEFKAPDIDGNIVDLSKYNVACNCGFTGGNYPQMQELHKKYEPQGLSVLAFPCNQFGGQEPKPEAEIKDFVKKFNVEFDMFSKINVNGDNAHPLYKYLKSKVDGTFGSFIKWNFSKFLIDRSGIPVKRYAPTTEPKSIEADIVNLLNQKA